MKQIYVQPDSSPSACTGLPILPVVTTSLVNSEELVTYDSNNTGINL